MPSPRRLALPLLLLVALLVAACGEAGGAADADPAKAVPAGTSIYIEGVVRPEGDQREDVLEAAGKLLRTDDPERKLRELFDKSIKEEDPDSSYAKDVEPWLGEKAGVWVTGVDRDKPGYAAVVATKDTEAAQKALDEGALEKPKGELEQRTYEDVDYQVDAEGTAAGIVGDYLVVGTEPEFKRTIRAGEGDSLADDKRYKATIDELEEERVGHFYMDLKPLVEQALKRDPQAQQQLEQIRSIFPVDKLEPLGGALLADGDRLAFDSIMRGPGVQSLQAFGPLFGTGETPLVTELPGDSWFAYGAPNVGGTLKTLFTRLAGAFGGAAAAGQLEQRYGINLDRDVFGWVGDIAVYARGRDKASLEGALVIKATNPGNMKSAFGKLVGLLQSEGGQRVSPVKVDGAAAAFSAGETDLGKDTIIARSDDRVVVAVGEQAAADGLSPAEKLGDAEVYATAKEKLGGDYEPTFLLSMPELIAAIDATGGADEDFQKAKPYLEAFDVIASGGKLEDDELESRLVAGLK